jgi:hypothetical protein
MSNYNIREKFTYTLATSSIEYIRNYNFNTATVTDIPLTMTNSDTEVPITVNITTTYPWIKVVDRITGKSLKYPEGNVVLAPTSSNVVLVKIDLPPEIENIPETTVTPTPLINIQLLSGSFLVTSSQNTNTQSTGSATEPDRTSTEGGNTSTGGGGSTGGADASSQAQF